MSTSRPQTRIQKKNKAAILEAALSVFSRHGFRGATLDQIANEAGLSKPNLLYYFPSKVSMHQTLLSNLLHRWLDPLIAIEPEGEPVEEVLAYVLRKLEMARLYPRESRLFANEIVQGAPNFMDQIEGELKVLVDEKAALFTAWMKTGSLAKSDPYHLIFSIWATTQHYADYDAQVRIILRPQEDTHFADAAVYLETLFRRMLTPVPGQQ